MLRVELGEDLISLVCLELNARALVSSWKVENLDDLNVGWLGVFIAPTTKLAVWCRLAVEWCRDEELTIDSFHLQQLAWLEARAARLPKPSSPQAVCGAVSPRQWAAHFNATCQGALLNARLHGDLALYDLSVAPLLNQFASAPQA